MMNCNYLSQNYNDQAGCIPIRIKKDENSTNSLITQDDIQIMLVTSGTSGMNWVFPKGSIKKSESNKKAAKRETFEESGIKGKILHQLSPITLADHNKGVNITYFPLFVGKKKNTKKEWMEQTKRQRKWFRLSKVLPILGEVKPHIEAAILQLQRSIGTLQQQLNTTFNLQSVPLDQFPQTEIADFVIETNKKKKKDVQDGKEGKKKKEGGKKDKKKKNKENGSDPSKTDNGTTASEPLAQCIQ
ncbi:hypothetical protein DICPUDRAFT_49581 [Dictyostelium purpureum]|uniref:Nudix hydrolase domain-containing protein n=1 Tax=Dictyostelium purpureum TaxID=5786 RepID=F0ZUA3_DICPU|nr:uncharacterized protein DICPUDRAFT_49581 [Dictyostelium purpureum]EGC32462.1 hypothetical protein DICPUDRAFT_49581 [Dictyostelium purpureum]|eukprot:XP_003290996.1 hypothetical protein DICPUDRAFT_49581 [Dictyostelium purpureum]